MSSLRVLSGLFTTKCISHESLWYLKCKCVTTVPHICMFWTMKLWNKSEIWSSPVGNGSCLETKRERERKKKATYLLCSEGKFLVIGSIYPSPLSHGDFIIIFILGWHQHHTAVDGGSHDLHTRWTRDDVCHLHWGQRTLLQANGLDAWARARARCGYYVEVAIIACDKLGGEIQAGVGSVNERELPSFIWTMLYFRTGIRKNWLWKSYF